jgi:thymidylate synthase (FAD)
MSTRDLLAEPEGRTPVLGGGWVELVDMMPRLVDPARLGAECAITDAARISYGHAARGARAPAKDRHLLRFLLRHRHTTPFEKVVFTFAVRAPLFVARQWMRHRTGSFNEVSARYTEVGAAASYAPESGEVRAQDAAPHANAQSGGAPLGADAAAAAGDAVRAAWDHSHAAYAALLEAGVARELARVVLPVSMFTTFVWKIDLWNLFHFLDLRLAPDAQEQIRAYAEVLLAKLRAVVPHAVEAFEDYVRNAVTLSALEVRALRTGATGGMSAREKRDWAAKRGRLLPPAAGAADPVVLVRAEAARDRVLAAHPDATISAETARLRVLAAAERAPPESGDGGGGPADAPP